MSVRIQSTIAVFIIVFGGMSAVVGDTINWGYVLLTMFGVLVLYHALCRNDPQKFEFRIVLSDVSSITQDLEDRLFCAGCDDALVSINNGKVSIDFIRSAPSLEEAISSAKCDVHRAGYEISTVETGV